MSGKQLLAVLRASWWLPVAGLLLGFGLLLALSLGRTPLYTSETQVFVSTTGGASATDVLQGGQFSQQRVASYAQLFTGTELARRVIERLDLQVTPEDLSHRIVATAVPGTVLVDVAVTDTFPARSQRIATAVGDEFIGLVKELEAPDIGSDSFVRVTVTEPANMPRSASSPNVVLDVVLGSVAGLLLGCGVAVGRSRLDRSVKDPEEMAGLGGAPVLGTVLRDDALVRRHVIDRSTANRAAEDYRQLRANLQFLNVDEPPKVIMVSSAMPAEGKTTVTINLALALAEAGRQVTILDADLRRPRVTNYLGMVGGVGLTNILAATADLGDVLQTYGDTGVQVIGAGPTPPNPSELLASKHMFALIDELRGKSEYVLIDAPPLLPVADSTGLGVIVDGVLLSVRYGKSRKDQLQQAAATLDRVGARTLGLILNFVPPRAGITGAYGYGYSYTEDADKKSR